MTPEARIERLEAQLERLEEREAELRRQLMEAQVDQWRARIEDLEVQAHLAAMDTSDKVTELLEQTRARWREAKAELLRPAELAGDVVDTVRNGIEDGLDEIRNALVEARDLARR